MADHTPVQADPQAIERAQQMWDNVVFVTKISIPVLAVGLLIMAFIFIH